ncbi:MAG: hypothetical protein JWP89_1006 [Schlesneria sp.]|nr:hypothetical protein [Schlesneria sp.]
MNHIRESDWKLLRRLQPIALDRFCHRVLSDVQGTCSDAAATAHERYLKVFGLIQDQNKTMAMIFDDIRRSNALLKVTLMRTSGLITDEEFAEFSEELRETIQRYQSI